MRSEHVFAVVAVGTVCCAAQISPAVAAPTAAARTSVPRAGPDRVEPRRAFEAPRRYTLAQLVRLARSHSPGISVARARVKAAQATLLKAKLLWAPNIKLKAMFAPVPNVSCVVPEAFRNVQMTDGSNLYTYMNANRESYCLGTDTSEEITDFFKSFSTLTYWFRADLTILQPLYTFGKIRFAKKLARAGVRAGRLRVRVARDEIVRNVRRAYFGLKLTRELLFEIDEGMKHLRKASKRVDRELDKESGEADLVDRYRLRILMAEVEDQTLVAKNAERLALAALRALIGRRAPKNLDVDSAPLGMVVAKVKPLNHYLKLARKHRAELKLLRVAMEASKAAVKLSISRFLPDFGLVMRLYAKASGSKDDPSSVYLSDQLHGVGFFVGIALKWDLNFHLQYADLAKARAQLVATRHLREQASLGLELQIEQAHGQLETSYKRLKLIKKAKKAARSWLTTMSQRHTIGVADTKKLTDAVKAYFQVQLKLHQTVFEFNMAAAELSRAVGTDITTAWSSRSGK